METIYHGKCTCPQNRNGDIESKSCIKKRFDIECPVKGYFILKVCSETYRSLFWEKYEFLRSADYEYTAQCLLKEIIFSNLGVNEYNKPYKYRYSKSLHHQTCHFNIYKNIYISVNLLELVEHYYNHGYIGSLGIMHLIKDGLKTYVNNLGEYKKYQTVKKNTITLINKINRGGEDVQILTNEIFLKILKLKEYETN